MRISTPWFFQRGLAAVQEQQAKVAATQQQLATGKRLLTPSDDPAGTGRLLDLGQALALNRQYSTNADQAVSRLSREESVVASIGNLLQRVRELTVQGNNAVLADGDRASIAQEVQNRLAELRDLANSQDAGGDYLFAGHSSRTRPFTRAPGGGYSYAGDDGARMLQVGSETRVRINDPGSDLFQRIRNGNGTFVTAASPTNTGSGLVGPGSVTDATQWDGDNYTITINDVGGVLQYDVTDGGGASVASGNYVDGAAVAFRGVAVTLSGTPADGDTFTVDPSVNQDMFSTVQSVIDALAIDGSQNAAPTRRANAMSRALTDLDRSLDKAVQVRARIGARLNTVETEQQSNADFELYLQQNISSVSDVDVASAVTDLTRGTTSLEAAQRSFIAIQNLSLFDFI